MSDSARLAKIETNIEWIVETLRNHVDKEPCSTCINKDKVNTNRRLIFWTWGAIALTFIKGVFTNAP